MMYMLLMAALLVKHFVLDYVWQPQWMLQQKTPYGALGGIAHATAHGVGTLLCVSLFVTWPVALMLAVMDTVIHYHTDYAKSLYMEKYLPSPKSQQFWWAHGVDQLTHQLTYVLITVLCIWMNAG